jgi:hypothetical protein
MLTPLTRERGGSRAPSTGPRLERLLDAHATDEPQTHATYHRAMELEIAFLDDLL